LHCVGGQRGQTALQEKKLQEVGPSCGGTKVSKI
jgi:hypothetical protein